MKIRYAALAATTLAALASAPAFANDQLIASAGLRPAEAAGLSLTEIAVAKFNRNADHEDRQEMAARGTGGDWSQLTASAGIDADGRSLTEVAVAKFNRNADHDDRQVFVRGSGVTRMSRSVPTAAWAQLVSNAGLTPEQAAGMSLSEIAAAKFSRNADHDDRIPGYALGG